MPAPIFFMMRSWWMLPQTSGWDFISSFGYAVGYIGRCFPFIASILLYMFTPFGLDAMGAVKIGILINAVWWLVFTIPMMRRVHQKYDSDALCGNVFTAAVKQVAHTCRLIAKNRNIGLFLLAYFFYIDGVDTIIKLSTTYGQAVGLDTTGMIVALLVTQIVAFPAVLVFAKVSQRFSTKRVLLSCIVVYVGILYFGVFPHASVAVLDYGCCGRNRTGDNPGPVPLLFWKAGS